MRAIISNEMRLIATARCNVTWYKAGEKKPLISGFLVTVIVKNALLPHKVWVRTEELIPT